MSELEIAMGMIIDVFARYSGDEGNKQTLSKGELKVLMEKELPGFLQVGCRALGDRVRESTWGQAGLVREHGGPGHTGEGPGGGAWKAEGQKI